MATRTEHIDSNYKRKKQPRENHGYRKKRRQAKGNYARRKGVEGHCERRRKAHVWIRKEERDGSNGFSVPVKRTKRISGSANVRVGRRRTTNGKGR